MKSLRDVKLGRNTRIADFANLYECEIGDNTRIGTFVEIQKNAKVGSNVKVSSHTFICEGVTIGDNCFIGHGVMFVNDNYPRSTTPDGTLEADADWAPRFVKTVIGRNVSIGSNATLLGDISVGDGAIIGAGSMVTKNVPADEIWAGNPARMLRKREEAK